MNSSSSISLRRSLFACSAMLKDAVTIELATAAEVAAKFVSA